MSYDRRHKGRRHTDSDKCQKCGKKDCNMSYCSEEYQEFYQKQEEINFELKLIFNSIKEILKFHRPK